MDISEYFIGQVSGCFWMNLKPINPSETWTSGEWRQKPFLYLGSMLIVSTWYHRYRWLIEGNDYAIPLTKILLVAFDPDIVSDFLM
jgi:hypothetical protein